jgi:hypothetical protein
MIRAIRERIESLGPYPSLFLLVVPAAVVEPLKLVAVAAAGEGALDHRDGHDHSRLCRQLARP